MGCVGESVCIFIALGMVREHVCCVKLLGFMAFVSAALEYSNGSQDVDAS